MNNKIYNDSKCKTALPSNFGWLEYELGQEEMDYLWECVRCKEDDVTDILAGNLESSFNLIDKNNWFFDNILINLVEKYENCYGLTETASMNWFDPDAPIDKSRHESYLKQWWVNYQNKYEFNPLHKHSGIYSFVIWLKIPTSYLVENEDNVSNSKVKSNFCFSLTNTLGQIRHSQFDMDPSYEGKMLFFPSEMHHQVYPYYTSDEQRISISGNVSRRMRMPDHMNRNQHLHLNREDQTKNKKEKYFTNGKMSITLSIEE